MGQHLFQVMAFMGWFQGKVTKPFSTGSKPVVSTHNSGPPSECHQPEPVLIGKVFVIDEGYLLLNNMLKEGTVVRLFFCGMREKKIGFIRDQFGNMDLFYTQEHIACRDITADMQTKVSKLIIGKASDLAGLDNEFDIGKPVLDLPGTPGSYRNPPVGRGFGLFQDSNYNLVFHD